MTKTRLLLALAGVAASGVIIALTGEKASKRSEDPTPEAVALAA